MISENAIRVSGKASRELEEQMAEYLAAGGVVQHLPAPTFAPRPLQEVRYCLTPPPPVRRRKPAPVSAAVVTRKARPPRLPTPEEVARKERDAKVAELAKTMTCRQASEHTGIPLRTLAGIATRNGFSFVNTWATCFVDQARDAELIARIPRLKNIGLTRRQCARTLGISETMLRRLLKVSGIDYPKLSGSRPRK